MLNRILEYIVEVNNEHKKKCCSNSVFNKGIYKKEEIEWSIRQNNDKSWCLYRKANNSVGSLTSLSDILDILNMHPCGYITNISVLKRLNKINSIYILDKYEWSRILNYAKSHEKFSLIKVDDMASYFSKLVLSKKITILHKTPCYTIFSDKIELFVVSDILLAADFSTNITFRGTGLRYINIDNLDITRVIDLKGFCCDCENLESVVLKNFDTSNVKDFSLMFCNCHNLKMFNMAQLNITKGSLLSYMFGGCKNLETMDLSSVDINNVTSMQSMLENCYNLRYVDIHTWKLNNNKYDLNCINMFRHCKFVSISPLDILLDLLDKEVNKGGMVHGTQYENIVKRIV